jgi:lipid-A-disaccharide synthase-like uncharacterized protein
MTDIRAVLYPLGFLASLAFSARGLSQWLYSEAKGTSSVTHLFWRLSLVGNVLLLIHSLIQSQVHVALVQTANGLISWRNLNLLGPHDRRIRFRNVVTTLIVALIATLIVSSRISVLFTGSVDWIRVPTLPWTEPQQQHASPTLHFLGTVGMLLFASRFWIQWWCAEMASSSVLPATFWWISLIGAALSLFYFGAITDPVNLVGPLFGMIPYIANLRLIYRKRSG